MNIYKIQYDSLQMKHLRVSVCELHSEDVCCARSAAQFLLSLPSLALRSEANVK